jgi:hypothetical protein
MDVNTNTNTNTDIILQNMEPEQISPANQSETMAVTPVVSELDVTNPVDLVDPVIEKTENLISNPDSTMQQPPAQTVQTPSQMEGVTPTPTTSENEQATSSTSGSRIQFFLKGMNGKTSVIECNSDDKIENIRLRVAEKENVAPENQRLIFSGRQLEDGHCLNEYGVQNNNTVFLVMRMKGGFGAK